VQDTLTVWLGIVWVVDSGNASSWNNKKSLSRAMAERLTVLVAYRPFVAYRTGVKVY
jgi:hypothetical protein